MGSGEIAPVCVLGVGNILLGDEGLGVRVVEALAWMNLPDGVEVVDGGTAGADLVEVIADRRKVIIVDCVDAGVPPGTLLRMDVDDLAPDGAALSLHEIGVRQAFILAERLGCAPREAVVLGMQGEDIRPGLELSAVVAVALPTLIERVRREIASCASDASPSK